MKDETETPEAKRVSALASGVRLDLIIALCALLISTLAAGASWWQARIVQAQTQILEEQLGAQVWPYVSVSEGLNNNAVQITIANDGLGPAVLRSATGSVDGVSRHSFVDIMHAILGPNIVARVPHGEKISLTLNDTAPGSVIRAGDKITMLALTSQRFAAPFVDSYSRLRFRLCYCAIIPGRCWVYDSGFSGDPRTVERCPEIAGDLLHATSMEALTKRRF